MDTYVIHYLTNRGALCRAGYTRSAVKADNTAKRLFKQGYSARVTANRHLDGRVSPQIVAVYNAPGVPQFSGEGQA